MSVLCARLLDAEVFEDRDALRAPDAARDLARASPRRRRRARSTSAIGISRSAASTLVGAARVIAQERAIDEILLDEHREQRGEREGVGAGPHLEVEVGELGGLGAARVDHDQRALRDPSRSRAARRARAGSRATATGSCR